MGVIMPQDAFGSSGVGWNTSALHLDVRDTVVVSWSGMCPPYVWMQWTWWASWCVPMMCLEVVVLCRTFMTLFIDVVVVEAMVGVAVVEVVVIIIN